MFNHEASSLSFSLSMGGAYKLSDLSGSGLSRRYVEKAKHALHGDHVLWGMPFTINNVHVIHQQTVEISFPGVKAAWLCFLHTAEIVPDPASSWNEKTLTELKKNPDETLTSYLNKLAATYYIVFEDGSEKEYKIRHRHQINIGNPMFGDNCFQAVPHISPSIQTHEENSVQDWGSNRTVHNNGSYMLEGDTFMNWICAWKNPYPDKKIVGMRIEPGLGAVILSAITACNTQQTPIRWLPRKKVLLTLPNGSEKPDVEKFSGYWGPANYQSAYMFLSESRKALLRIDMGQIISIVPRFSYPNSHWHAAELGTTGKHRTDEFIVEYAAHPEANFYLENGEAVSIPDLEKIGESASLKVIPPADKTVSLKVVDIKSRQKIAVRLHIHGQYDEYLTPVNRQRIPSGAFFEDYSPDFAGPEMHTSTYIDGETVVKLPVGKVYIEISKGFECKPIHKVVTITNETTEIIFEIERITGWSENGWVSADTHVHFLSPITAHLEGAAEGVNVVNLLASQWGELMSNVGDFDGQSTFSSHEAGNSYLVRVGTENRQHALGHISLLGYTGSMITPLCSGGVNESALGDPVEILMTEWAQRCRDQGGLVVAPHFPRPRGESAATIVSGLVDAVEMNGYHHGIKPAALVNWYRYLNCGFQVPLSGGTDKMFSGVEIGRIRVYSKLQSYSEGSTECSYDAWMDSIRSGNTFVTIGPLMEFSVNGYGAGSRIALNKTGGQTTVTWRVETVKYQMTAVELIINGEIVEGKPINGDSGEGYFEINIDRSSWVCLLVRGKMTGDTEEVILAHSSSVMIEVADSEFFSVTDAVGILEQIEGSVAYLDHVGTRAETKRYQEMRLILEQAHKSLHDRLHWLGYDHAHDFGHKHH